MDEDKGLIKGLMARVAKLEEEMADLQMWLQHKDSAGMRHRELKEAKRLRKVWEDQRKIKENAP